MARKLLDFIKGRKCMCLDAGTKAIQASTLVESGFKCFAGSQDKPRFQSVNWKGKHEVPLDQWITAEETNAGEYTSGFHIFTREKEHSMPIRRVYFRRAHTKGRQNAHTVVVAKEMYVPSDPDAWPPK